MSIFYSRFTSSKTIKKHHPKIQTDILKFVDHAEEIVISALFAASAASDEQKRALIHEFAMASGPRAAMDISEPLSGYEWDIGRVKFLLKSISMFDELPSSLQLQLYPSDRTLAQTSILGRIEDCVNTISLSEFVPDPEDDSVQEKSDLYFRILAELCLFAFLVQPRQFAQLQVDMMGLVLGQSELWSLIARDWWVCIARKLGHQFTVQQVFVLTELVCAPRSFSL